MDTLYWIKNILNDSQAKFKADFVRADWCSVDTAELSADSRVEAPPFDARPHLKAQER